MKMKLNDQTHLVDETSKILNMRHQTCQVGLFVAPLVGIMFPKCILKRLKPNWFINEQQIHKMLDFLFKILKDNKDFFHGCKHDYEHCEI
jgi:hypothetical protein